MAGRQLALRLSAVSLLLGLSGCGGDSTPRAVQPPTGLTDLTWVGTRSVVAVTSGADSCLGRMLATRTPDPVRLDLPANAGRDFWGTLSIGAANESCVVRGDREAAQLTWYEYRCVQNCWWDAVTCDGRSWSFCRVPYGENRIFSGFVSDSRIEGTQSYRFYLVDGEPGRDEVTLVFAYNLRR